MTINDIMKYVESEYSVINNTPCEICGGGFIAEGLGIEMINNMPYDICECVCSKCGHEKTFEFIAPFADEKNMKKIMKRLN